MDEKKSMGSALVDVFDAGVVLVKSEINGVAKKVGDVAKAKGVGAVLLLGAIGPLLMGLIFLILFVFYGLMRLGLGAWAAALIIALVSMALAGALALLGIQKLGAEVDTTPARRPVNPADLAPGGAMAPAGGPAGSPQSTSVPVSSLRYPGAAAASSAQHVGAQPQGYAQVPTEGGSASVPVYESKPDGEAQNYGSGLNKKLDGHDHHDPNLQNPVVIRGAPGISVSTDPTFREDMKKEGY